MSTNQEESSNHIRFPIILSLRFLDVVDLCKFSETSKSSFVNSNVDSLWRDLCEIYFREKCVRLFNGNLFSFGAYAVADLTRDDIIHILRIRGVRGSLIDQSTKQLENIYEKSSLVVNTALPTLKGKYKCSLANALIDSHRVRITKHEIGYFRWKLFYQNRPSATGIRHFREDGVYISPYLGQATWDLTNNGDFIIHKFTRPLSVRRRREDWGWTIGKGSRSEYWSILPSSVITKSAESLSFSNSSRQINMINRLLTHETAGSS